MSNIVSSGTIRGHMLQCQNGWGSQNQSRETVDSPAGGNGTMGWLGWGGSICKGDVK